MVCETSSSTPELKQPLLPLHATLQLLQVLQEAAPTLCWQRRNGHHQAHSNGTVTAVTIACNSV